MKSVPRDFVKDSLKKSPWQNELRFSHFSEKSKFEVSILNDFCFDRPTFCQNVFTNV